MWGQTSSVFLLSMSVTLSTMGRGFSTVSMLGSFALSALGSFAGSALVSASVSSLGLVSAGRTSGEGRGCQPAKVWCSELEKLDNTHLPFCLAQMVVAIYILG